MKKRLISLVLATVLTQASLFAEYCFPTYVGAEQVEVVTGLPVNYLSVSPVFGKAEMKQGTVKENGWLYGVRGNFDIISPNTLYLGAELGYKFGNLAGNGDATFTVVNVIDPATRIETPMLVDVEQKTKSKYSDMWGEFRVGFTLGNLIIPSGFVSPYFVVGYEKERDDFVSPSALELKHTLTYGYLGCGAVSKLLIMDQLSVGANVKFKWMFNSYAKTTGYADIQDKGISPGSYFHWELELPVTWAVAPNMTFGIAPFYQYKNYERHKLADAGKERTSFHMWGGLLQLGYAY